MFHCRLWRLLDDVAKEDFEKVAMETWQAQFRRKMGPVDEAIVEVHGKCFWEKMNYISVFLRNLDGGEIWWKYTCIHLFIYMVGVLARGIDDILMIKCCEDWGRNRFFHHSSWWNSQNFGGRTPQRFLFQSAHIMTTSYHPPSPSHGTGCWVSRPSFGRLQQHGYLAWYHSIDSNGLKWSTTSWVIFRIWVQKRGWAIDSCLWCLLATK